MIATGGGALEVAPQSQEEEMAVRIIVGLITLLAIIQGLAGDPIGGGILTLLLVILGLVYGALGVDAEDATAYLVVTLAAGVQPA